MHVPKKKLYQIKRMRQKLQYVTTHGGYVCQGAHAVTWLVLYIDENLIKLQNSILCSFYDDHLLDELGFGHTQLCIYKQTPFG